MAKPIVPKKKSTGLAKESGTCVCLADFGNPLQEMPQPSKLWGCFLQMDLTSPLVPETAPGNWYLLVACGTFFKKVVSEPPKDMGAWIMCTAAVQPNMLHLQDQGRNLNRDFNTSLSTTPKIR